VHGDDIAAGGDKRLEAGEEVTHRWLRGRGKILGVAQPLVEGVEVVLVLGWAVVAPPDVEAHLVDPPALDQVWGKVGRAVGDDGDTAPKTLPLFAWSGAHGRDSMRRHRFSSAPEGEHLFEVAEQGVEHIGERRRGSGVRRSGIG
jgi:hypothetical protein